jgi:hypothetical protein
MSIDSGLISALSSENLLSVEVCTTHVQFITYHKVIHHFDSRVQSHYIVELSGNIDETIEVGSWQAYAEFLAISTMSSLSGPKELADDLSFRGIFLSNRASAQQAISQRGLLAQNSIYYDNLNCISS